MSKHEMQNNIQMGIIILLLVIIAVMGFFLGKLTNPVTGTANTENTTVNTTTNNETNEPITMTVIDDIRCKECNVEGLILKLRELPSLSNVEVISNDFSDKGIEEYLTENNIKALPAVIFKSNNIDIQLNNYLKPLPNGEFYLQGGEFNPFQKRSERGFLLLDNETLDSLKGDSYIKGKKDSKITWLEYTDVNCFYCKKMEKDGTGDKLFEKFPNNLNKATSNFIGVGGEKSQKAAELLECIGKVNGGDSYNEILSEILISGESSEAGIFSEIDKNGLNKLAIQSCYDNGDTKEIVEKKFKAGINTFGITGTPGNVLINNETGEYQILSGAYPVNDFEAAINRLLK